MSERDRVYYQKNKERIKLKSRAWYKANKPRALEKMREWKKLNRPLLAKCARVRREKNPATHRAAQIKYRYGITVEQYADMMKWQDGKCRICEIDFSCSMKPHVDHCHTTKRVRALLCGPCNHGIGFFRDNPRRLRAAADYLERP